MSYTEYNFGKIKLEFKGETSEELEQYLSTKYNDKGNYASFIDYVRNEDHLSYMIMNKKELYKIIESTEIKETELTINDDGTISFVSVHYNGGGSLQESLQFALNKISARGADM